MSTFTNKQVVKMQVCVVSMHNQFVSCQHLLQKSLLSVAAVC